MNPNRSRRWIIAAIGVAFVIGYFSLPYLWPTRLEFRDLNLQGFRELVMGGEASSFDPLTADDRSSRTRTSTDMKVSSAICDALFGSPPSTIIVGSDAPVPVAAFFDYRCPYCKKLQPILSRMEQNGRIRLVHKEWPILGDASVLAARATLAAARQGRYAELHARLMASGFIPTPGYIEAVATELGIDSARLFREMDLPEIAAELEETAGLAMRLGFVGTPSLVVGRTIVKGAVSERELEALVDVEKSSTVRPPC